MLPCWTIVGLSQCCSPGAAVVVADVVAVAAVAVVVVAVGIVVECLRCQKSTIRWVYAATVQTNPSWFQ